MGGRLSPRGGGRACVVTAVLLLSASAAFADLITSDLEELAGSLALQGSKGIKLVLNAAQPKLTMLGLSAACPDGASTGCNGQFLMQAVKDVYEVDASGARVANRSASDVLNTSLASGSWATSAAADLSSSTVPPVNASSATFSAPFKPSPPPCPAGPAPLAQPQPSDGRFAFTVLLFSNDTNFTAAPGQEAVEVLAGNVKTTLDISSWPFCAADHWLVVELALKSTKLGAPDAPRSPLVRNGSEAEAEAEQLARQLYDAVGAAPEEEGDDPAPPTRRSLLSRGGSGEGGGGQQDGEEGRPRLSRWAALLQLPLNRTQEGVQRAMNATAGAADEAQRAANATRSALVDKLARRRPIAGLGRPTDTSRLFLALPGAGAIDSKLDVPASALIDGVLTNITVAALALPQGERVQRILLTFPAFSDSLSYDPTAAFATSDQALNQQLSGALQEAANGTGAPASSARSTRHLGGVLALAGGAAAALLVV